MTDFFDAKGIVFQPSSNGIYTGVDAKGIEFKFNPSSGGFDVTTYGAVGDGTTDDTTAIQNAINAANTAGGGVVLLGAKTYYIPSGIDLTGINGVIIKGTGWALSPANAVINGTRLLGNGTNPGIRYIPTTYVAQPTSVQAIAQGLSGIAVRDIALDTFTYGIQGGTQYNTSFFHSKFENLTALNSTQWGFWFENFQECTFNRLYIYAPSSGGVGNAMFAASQSAFTEGNSHFFHIYGQNGTSKQRGIIFRAYGGVVAATVAINDLTVIDVQNNQKGANISATATGNGTTSIALSAVSSGTVASSFPVDTPVTAAAVGGSGWGPGWETFFVTSNDGTNITISPSMGETTSNVTISAGTYTIYTNGYPSIEIEGYGNHAYNVIQPSEFHGIDAEGTCSTPLLVQSADVHLDIGTLFNTQGTSANQVFTSFVGRNISGTWRGSSAVTVDFDAQCKKNFTCLGSNLLTDTYPNTCNVNANLAGIYFDRANSVQKLVNLNLSPTTANGAGAAVAFGATTPTGITTPASVNSWLTIKMPDNTTGYIPIWK